MQPAIAVGILCIVGAVAFAGPATYTIDVTEGQLTWQVTGGGSTTGGLTGTFAVTIDPGDGHIGESDTFILEEANLSNPDHLQLVIAGLATTHLYPYGTHLDDPSSLGFALLDFAPVGPGHIGPGGQGTVDADAYAEVGLYVSGAFDETVYIAQWVGVPRPFVLNVSTSVAQSDVLTASLAGTYSWSLLVPDLELALTYDFIIDVAGTAHAVPDPSLGGLIALGLGGGGAWLRARRSWGNA
jgi:hypothetical protein